MAKRFLIFTLLLCLLFSHSLCDEEEDHWIQPSPPYNSTTIYIGEQYKIEWSSDLWKFFANNTPSADVTNSDLWISGFYEHQYAHVVTTRVWLNINRTPSLIWTVQLPSDELSATEYWIFRFTPSGVDPRDTSKTINSPGFRVQNTTTASTIASSTSSTSSSTDSSHPSTSAQAPTSTPVPTPRTTSRPSPGLSGGAKAGIAIGATLGAALLVLLGWVMARKRSPFSRNRQAAAPSNSPTIYPEAITGTVQKVNQPSTSDQTWSYRSSQHDSSDSRARQSREGPGNPREDPISQATQRDDSYVLRVPIELDDQRPSTERI